MSQERCLIGRCRLPLSQSAIVSMESPLRFRDDVAGAETDACLNQAL